MPDKPYPTEECTTPNCHSRIFWKNPTGHWTCASCHPDPNEIDRKNIEKIALIERCKAGNIKLVTALQVIRKYTDNVKETEQWDKWVEAQHKLAELIENLRDNYKFDECLFIENGKKTRDCLKDQCILCSCSYEKGVKYWEKGLFS